MSRTLSLAALSTLLLATAIEAYPGGALDSEGFQATVDQPQGSVPRLSVSTGRSDAAPIEGDNCGVDGYAWLSADGQPVDG